MTQGTSLSNQIFLYIHCWVRGGQKAINSLHMQMCERKDITVITFSIKNYGKFQESQFREVKN